jgi:hypothetical protein
MRFVLTIECDNAAFEGDLHGETQRCLRRAIEKLSYQRDGTILDVNGNTVGRFGFEEGVPTRSIPAPRMGHPEDDY